MTVSASRLFKFGDSRKSHAADTFPCEGCDYGFSIPCPRYGCAGLVHFDHTEAGENERGKLVDFRIVSKCDICGDSAVSAANHDEVVTALRRFGPSAKRIASELETTKPLVLSELREEWTKVFKGRWGIVPQNKAPAS
jgi:hypothetical protein